MGTECFYAKRPKFLEGTFRAKSLAGGEIGQSEPRVILSTIEAGNLRYDNSSQNPSRQQFLRDLDIAESRVLAVNLVHSRQILIVEDKNDAENLCQRAEACGGVDGIITTNPQYIPSVTVADCMPIWLWVEDSPIFGVLHSGWKGTGILGTAVTALKSRFGVCPNRIHVIFGPAIGSCCYNVDEVRAKRFASEFGGQSVSFRSGSWFIDLRKANQSLADSLSLGSVQNITICTHCDYSMGSSRRQGQASFTRMLALCGFF